MIFANPIGLLGLLAVAALILIYILKPKYQEKKLSSTFVWKLSLAYKKRKIPFQWLQRSLLFFVQILILVFLTFMLARPMLALPDKSMEKIVILDASASMMAEKDGTTRFDRAVKRINELVEQKSLEEKITIIYGSSKASYVVRRADNSEEILEKLNALECSFEEINVDLAVELASQVQDENESSEVMFYTDKKYSNTGYIKVIDVTNSEWNAAILSFDYKKVEGKIIFQSKIGNYGRKATLNLVLTVQTLNYDEEKEDMVDVELIFTHALTLEDGKTKLVIWDASIIDDFDALDNLTEFFKEARLVVESTDDFKYDNEFYIFGKREFKVQCVSAKTDYYIWAMLSSIGEVDFEWIYPPEKEDREGIEKKEVLYEGYDLYIFEDCDVLQYPKDGSIWLINPTRLPVESDIIFSNQTVYSKEPYLQFTTEASSNTELTKDLTKNVASSEFLLVEYTKIEESVGYDIVYTSDVDNDPLILAKQEGGRKTVVFTFDVSDTNFSEMSTIIPYSRLIRNIKNFLLKHTVAERLLEVGARVEITPNINTEIIEISDDLYVTTYENIAWPISFKVEVPGLQVIIQKLPDENSVEDVKFFAKIKESDSIFDTIERRLVPDVYVNLAKGVTGSGPNNYAQEIIMYLAGALILFILVEWGLQYRELF